MANFATGNFTHASGAATDSVTGLGFTPKAVIIWSTRQGVAGYVTHCFTSFGFSDGTNQGSIGWRTETAKTVSNTICVRDDVYVIKTLNTTADTTRDAASLTIDSDGFTLTWDVDGISTWYIYYTAIGGSEVSAKVGTLNCPTSTGSESVTGIGFRPTGLITLYNIISGTSPENWARYMIGVAGNPNNNQFVICGNSEDGTTGKGEGGQHDKLFEIFLGFDDERLRANLTSFGSDGWTVNWDVVPALSLPYFYLALGGLNVNVGTFNQAVTPNTGNQSVTGVDFSPIGTMFLTANQDQTRSGLLDDFMRISIGSATSSSNKGSTWTGDRGNVTTTLSSRGMHLVNQCFSCVSEGTPTVTENSIADFVSNDGSGFTINNTTVDSVSRKIGYVCFSQYINPTVWIKGGSILGGSIL